MLKVCEHCGKKYEAYRSFQRFCCYDCRDIALNEKSYKKRNVNKNKDKEIYKNEETKKLIHKLYIMLEPYRTVK